MKPEIKLGLWCLGAFGILSAGVLASGSGARCTVHRERLHRGLVKVTYGLVGGAWRPGYLFPNANTRALGGCVVTPFSPPFSVVEYCPACREALRAWNAKNPNGISAANRAFIYQANSRWFRTHKSTYYPK